MVYPCCFNSHFPDDRGRRGPSLPSFSIFFLFLLVRLSIRLMCLPLSTGSANLCTPVAPCPLGSHAALPQCLRRTVSLLED